MANTKALERLKFRSHCIELSTPQNRPSIYRVHKHLRDLNKNAYEPDIVAIGPYHRGKDNLQMMEDHNWQYLKSLLLRVPWVEIESYFLVVERREQEARNCYEEFVSLAPDKFIEMLVLDGCFIVELILRFVRRDSTINSDPIFQTLWILNSLQRDLMLFENQIPFFILCDFFVLIDGPQRNNFGPIDHVLYFFQSLHPGADERKWRKSKSQEVKHILDLLYINWCHSSDDDNITINLESNTAGGAVERNRGANLGPLKRILPDLLHCNWSHSPDVTINVESDTANSESYQLIPSASELRDYNVKFQMKKSSNLFGVQFVKSTISMAPLTIHDHTECVFRNLIAYEQYFPSDRPTPFTDYTTLLDCLINSSTDVEILSRCKIFENWLGDNEVVARIFNRLGDSVTCGCPFLYANTFHIINTHCQRKRNRAMAKLKRNYFNSPWAYVSFFAALLLLLFTIAQTILSAIQLP